MFHTLRDYQAMFTLNVSHIFCASRFKVNVRIQIYALQRFMLLSVSSEKMVDAQDEIIDLFK